MSETETHSPPPDLELLLRAYPARSVKWESEGRMLEASCPGGALAAAVEQHGLGPLMALLAPGERLTLTDEAAELWLQGEGLTVRLQVRWSGGPAYEERVTRQSGARALESLPAPILREDSAPEAPTAELPAAVLPLPAAALEDPLRPLWLWRGQLVAAPPQAEAQAVPTVDPLGLGSAAFRRAHAVRASYVAGEMAGGIASPEMVIAMGRAGLLGFYGAGGLDLAEVGRAIDQIQAALGAVRQGYNLLHNPAEPAVEMKTVELYLSKGCRLVSASAFMTLTPAIVRYRCAGLRRGPDGRVLVQNRVMAKISRPETAEAFLRPPPPRLLAELVELGLLSPEEAELGAGLPMAEDVTVEGDSGGHTDRRPLLVVLPAILRLRDRISAELGYAAAGLVPRVGAAGGLGDPRSIRAAFAMGADYVLTGSINQSCVEAGTSAQVKEMLARAGVADCTMGPAPDMFEIGAEVQVLGLGSMYAQRAGRLYELYRRHRSLEEIPAADREKVERTIFGAPIDQIWAQTAQYWRARDAAELARAEQDPHHRMALTFRWYLGQSSRWARRGEGGRQRDYQIWCGPAMGLFNDWTRGTPLAELPQRRVVEVGEALLRGAAALQRQELARALGWEG